MASPITLTDVFLAAAIQGEIFARAGHSGYWVRSHGHDVEHFLRDIRRSHKMLTEALEAYDATQTEEAA